MNTDSKTITDQSARYFQAIGRRKTAVASVRLIPQKKSSIVINGKELNKYFPTDDLRQIIRDSFTKIKMENNFSVSAKLSGGGIVSQAEALRHGIARALVSYEGGLRKTLKKAGFLKRDPRAKERRKFGLKKARKAPQWSKR